MCTPVVNADFIWWGGEGYIKNKDTHTNTIIIHRRPSDHTDTVVPGPFPFLKTRKIKHKF